MLLKLKMYLFETFVGINSINETLCRPLATAPSSSRGSSRGRATLRCRWWATSTATWSTSTTGTVPSSAGIRRSAKIYYNTRADEVLRLIFFFVMENIVLSSSGHMLRTVKLVCIWSSHTGFLQKILQIKKRASFMGNPVVYVNNTLVIFQTALVLWQNYSERTYLYFYICFELYDFTRWLKSRQPCTWTRSCDRTCWTTLWSSARALATATPAQ